MQIQILQKIHKKIRKRDNFFLAWYKFATIHLGITNWGTGFVLQETRNAHQGFLYEDETLKLSMQSLDLLHAK